MNNLKEFPVLATGKLILRQIREDDLNDYFLVYSNDKVLRYYGVKPYKSADDVLGLMKRTIGKFEKKRGVRWAICKKGEDKLIGTIGYKNWDSRSLKGEISYDLLPEYWGKGYMTQCVLAVTKFGFDNGLNRIEAWDMEENKASRQVLEKCGFIYEGTHRQSMMWAGELRNIEWFSILKSDVSN